MQRERIAESGNRAVARRMRTAMYLMVATLCGLFAFFALHHPHKVMVEDELVGTWRSDAPAYADRFFEMRGDMIVLGLGNDRVSVQTISGLERQEHEYHTDYIIHTVAYDDEAYRPEDKHETTWLFAYRADDGGIIQFNHQPGKWRKTSGEAPLLK